MIATRHGLAVLVALAIALAIVVLASDGAPAVEDHALVAGLEVDHVGQLAWQRADASTVISRRGPRWEWEGGWADPATVDRVLTALRGARWQRRGQASAAGEVRASLFVDGSRAVIGLGQPLQGAEQTWLVVGDSALLVDDWVARALMPAPLDLRVKRPLADAASASTVALASGSLAVSIDTRHGTMTSGTTELRLDPNVVAEVTHALTGLAIVKLPASRIPAGDGLRVTVSAPEPATAGDVAGPPMVVQLVGACPGDPALVALRATSGDGCVERSAADEVERVAAKLGGAADAIVDRRPAAGAVKVKLVDGSVLELARRPTVNGKPAEPGFALALRAVLDDAAEPTKLPTTPATGALEVTDDAGKVTRLELHGNVVVAGDPPRALKLSNDAALLLMVPGSAVASHEEWSEDPVTVSSITVDAATYDRGPVLGEWLDKGKPVDKAIAAALDELAVRVSSPVSVGPATEPHGKLRNVAFVVTPPVGGQVTHALEAGPAGKACAAQFDKLVTAVDERLCTALRAIP